MTTERIPTEQEHQKPKASHQGGGSALTSVLDEVRSSGEENLVGIAALGKALVLLERVGLPVIESQERKFTSRLLRGMAAIPGVQVFGLRDPDSPRADIDGFPRILGQIARRPRRLLDRLTAGYHGGTSLARTPVQDEVEASARQVAERVY